MYPPELYDILTYTLFLCKCICRPNDAPEDIYWKKEEEVSEPVLNNDPDPEPTPPAPEPD